MKTSERGCNFMTSARCTLFEMLPQFLTVCEVLQSRRDKSRIQGPSTAGNDTARLGCRRACAGNPAVAAFELPTSSLGAAASTTCSTSRSAAYVRPVGGVLDASRAPSRRRLLATGANSAICWPDHGEGAIWCSSYGGPFCL
jgi:hypothetical protein